MDGVPEHPLLAISSTNCHGNLGEVAVVLSSALVSVLLSWPKEAGCEMLVRVGRRLHRTLWAALIRGRRKIPAVLSSLPFD